MADLFRERKRWQLQDGPHGTLRRLRSQLAEDGCIESQLIIAQKLLDEGKGDVKKEEEAVSWLVKAAQEDSASARELLKNCFKQQTGVTAKNYKDVVNCLSTSDVEQVVRSAARELYCKLSVDGLVSSKALMDSLRNENEVNKEDDEVFSYGSNSSNSEVKLALLGESGVIYNEDDLLDLASKIATGKQLDHAVDWEEQNERLNNLTWREKLFNPWCYYSTSFTQVLDQIVAEGSGVLATIIYPNYLHLMLILLLEWTLYLEDITISLSPLFLFYFSFISLSISTLEMLHLEKWLSSLKQWIKILHLPSKNMSCEMFESLFLWNCNLTCYLKFFLSIIVLLFTYPLVPNKWIPLGEFSAISTTFFVVTFIAIGHKNDWLVTTSVILHIFLMAIPLLVLKLPTWEYIGDWIYQFSSIQVGPYLHLHFGFPSLFFSFIPLVFMTMFVRKSFYGIHRVLIPHLVSTFWLQLAVTFFLDSANSSLIRGLFTISSLIILFPFIYYVFLFIFSTCLIFSFIFFSGFFPFCCIVHISSFFYMCGLNERMVRLIRYGSIIGIAVSIIPPLIVYYSSDKWDNWLSDYRPSPALNLSWTDYYHTCHHPAWSTASSVAKVQYQCRVLYGMPVNWQGSVLRIFIKKTTNKLEHNLSFLPKPISNWLRCLFGTRCPREFKKQHDLNEHFCLFRPGECHLTNWDVYSYDIVLGMSHNQDSADVFVEAGNSFTPFLLRVHRSDVVAFNGSLVGEVGGPRPTVRLSGIECVLCTHPLACLSVDDGLDFSKSFRSVFHFFLAPLFEFRDDSNSN